MVITESALKNPTAVIVAILLAVLFGVLSILQLPIQLTPDIMEPEITIEVPAIQMGTNKLNERYRIGTSKVFTENEFPEIG